MKEKQLYIAKQNKDFEPRAQNLFYYGEKMKRKIRKSILNLMKKIPINEESLYKKLFESSLWNDAKTVALTMSTDDELNTMPIIERGLAEKKQILIPKTFAKGKMEFFEFTSINDLCKTKFGILEPNGEQEPIKKNEIDLIIVPGIAFSKINNQRIGYGGGFYDRYLQNYQGKTVSLVRKIQLVDSKWIPELTDVPVQNLIVEEINDKK